MIGKRHHFASKNIYTVMADFPVWRDQQPEALVTMNCPEHPLLPTPLLAFTRFHACCWFFLVSIASAALTLCSRFMTRACRFVDPR